MADLASPTFLAHLKSLYPTTKASLPSSADVLRNPWYIAASCAFAAGNAPEAVPLIFNHVYADLENAQAKFKVSPEQAHQEKLLLARKMRDCIFKSGVVGGYSKAINALVYLSDVTPDELRDTEPLRDAQPMQVYEERGKVFFQSLYGETGNNVQALLNKIHPDMGMFSQNVAYGHVYGYLDVTDQLETAYTLVSTLIAVDTPRQINWHMDNARRSGASLEQAKAVRRIAMEVAEAAGVRWKDGVPEVKED